ncbi:hypothetical protein [Heyndrickxia oleronia]|uniref:Uncharacterized protein n=1 Tax=Heyndrickxia oleronia TaxID=38875 RepID=A0AAW6T110_9BACI|nr:hypothetical protein [Heyndrickxia oleronia]MDH5162556.1 hypothetical protein [Heyndrickxia oleronia]
MNATLRSINRSAVVIGAPLGGAIADRLGFLTALWISIAGLALCGVWFSLSSMRKAQIKEHETKKCIKIKILTDYLIKL